LQARAVAAAALMAPRVPRFAGVDSTADSQKHVRNPDHREPRISPKAGTSSAGDETGAMDEFQS
jgi:hypothetical protein